MFQQEPKTVSKDTDQALEPIICEDALQQLELGIKYLRSQKFSEAEAYFQLALTSQTNNPDAWHLLGVTSVQRQKYTQAIDQITQAIKIKPTEAIFYSSLGNVYLEQQQFQSACKSYQKALDLKPTDTDTRKKLAIACEKLLDLGIEHHRAKRIPEAATCYQQVFLYQAHRQDICADAWHLWGVIAYEENDYKTAIERMTRAIELNPNSSSFYNSLGAAYRGQKKFTEAINCYQKSLQLQPSFQQAHDNLAYVFLDQGNALADQGNYAEAIASCERALELKPDFSEALLVYVMSRRRICSWQGLVAYEKELLDASQSSESILPPFVPMAIADNPEIQLTTAKNFCNNVVDHSCIPLWNGQRYSHQKIRLAYLSADYHQHATAYLMAELFERHDCSRFEVFAFSFGPPSNSPMRHRLVRAFDHFIDVHQMSDLEVAQKIRNLEIDIAIDLKGYTKDNRKQILAYRPAPIQVNYLGYPSTMGADFIDYILVDPFIVPSDQQPYFTEKLVHLPDCYQVNDSKRTIAQYVPSREECNLPPQGFIFCGFNNSYKITPEFFNIWMRLLKAVPHSVLWLLSKNQDMTENLRQEAQARGVDPDRLVFAPKKDLPDHLARQQLADLFLDNLPCNAHTTTSDALWVGLPVLTCAGQSFAARVAGSLLHAIGLPELVTYNLPDYEALALKIATQPALLEKIKTKLQHNRLRTPLFDCDRFRRNIEAAYQQMWSISQQGKPPKAFNVKPNLNYLSKIEDRAIKQSDNELKTTRNYIFTIAPGHTRTMTLAALLRNNIPQSKIHHEILGYDKFGVDTPDISHLTLFNSQGNIPKIQDFWRQKFNRIIKLPNLSFYGETSHILAKAGLMENLEMLSSHGNIKIICLTRDPVKIVSSLIKGADFLNKGNIWLWHLDPNYPRKIVNPKPFFQFGINGQRLWYVYEMYTRAEYYKLIYKNHQHISFIDFDISDLSQPEKVSAFLTALGVSKENIMLPEPKNLSQQKLCQEELRQVSAMIDQLIFEPSKLANEFLNKGYRLS